MSCLFVCLFVCFQPCKCSDRSTKTVSTHNRAIIKNFANFLRKVLWKLQRFLSKTYRRPCRFVLFREEEKDDITEKTQEVRVILFDSRYEMSQCNFKYYDTCLFRFLFFRHPSWCILKVMWKPWKNNMLWKSNCCRRNTSKEMQMMFLPSCVRPSRLNVEILVGKILV